MTKLIFIKKEDKKGILNILGGPITFYQKGGHVLQKEDVLSLHYLSDIFSLLNELSYSLQEKYKSQIEAAKKVSVFKKKLSL